MYRFVVIKNNLLNTLAYVTVSDARKEITVNFRGTIVDLRNYLLDATLFNPGFNDIKFHLGFYVATMSLYNDVSHCNAKGLATEIVNAFLGNKSCGISTWSTFNL